MSFKEQLESLKHRDDQASSYFLAREVSQTIKYPWQQFEEVLKRHVEQAELYHFDPGVEQTSTGVIVGRNKGTRAVVDYRLTSFALLSILGLIRPYNETVWTCKFELAQLFSDCPVLL